MDNVLTPSEVDLFIDTMKGFDIENIGGKLWLDWHGYLSKLLQQGIVENNNGREEYVKERFAATGRIAVLIHEAILISIWKNKVLPEIMKLESEPPNTFTLYGVLYHEALCVTLIETMIFHPNNCESLELTAVDLLEYCCENIRLMFVLTPVKQTEFEDPLTEVRRHKIDLQFQISIRCIAILRYFAEYIERIPLSVAIRALCSLEVPSLLARLILSPPWYRKDENSKLLQYYVGKWRNPTPAEMLKLNQTEAQVWIGLQQFLQNSRAFAYYELTDYRKRCLLSLTRFLSDSIIDQLSPLVNLKQWLHQLSLNNLKQPVGKRPVVLEVLPQIKDAIIAKGKNNWTQFAVKQIHMFFKQGHLGLVRIAQSLCLAYDTQILEKLSPVDSSPCGNCGRNATKKCSKCRMESYCNRECQVKHWLVHRRQCYLFTEL